MADREMRIYPRIWLARTMGVDTAATGFYIRILASSEAEPVVSLRRCSRIVRSPKNLEKYIAALSTPRTPLVSVEGDDLRLTEWGVPSARWRHYGIPKAHEPLVSVSRFVKRPRRHLTRSERQWVIERDQRMCGICGEKVPEGGPLDLDHIIPLALGGDDDLSNLQVAHASCNRRKGARG